MEKKTTVKVPDAYVPLLEDLRLFETMTTIPTR